MEITVKRGRSFLREIPLEEIAEQYGTPFYLYDLDEILETIHRTRLALCKDIKLYYAIKANSNVEILKAIREKVDGLDISSYGEMEQSLLAGYGAQQLSFAGPGKTYGELEKAIKSRIGIISVESLREMDDIRKLSFELHAQVNIAIRVNPSLFIREFAIKMGGQTTQFGIDEEKLSEAVDYLKRNDGHFIFKGIHVYSGTQCMDEAALIRNVSNVLEIAKTMEEEYDLMCSWINLGGGFGVSYHDHQTLNIEKMGEGIKKAILDYKKCTKGNPKFVFELGRYFVTAAGIYVAKVVSCKDSRGKRYFILDGGMNHHLAASGNFGQILKKNFMVKNLSNPNGEMVKCHLVGPLCTTLDILGRDVALESPNVGDVIAFLNSGSYGFTSSPLLFLGHETPIEFLATGGDVRVIRNRKKLTDFT